jgi:plastocyanin
MIRRVFVCVFVLGCPKAAETPDTGARMEKPKVRIDPATTGTVSGTIRFEAQAPEPTMLSLSSDGACVKARPGTFDAGDVRVDAGNVAAAFVWIAAGLEGYAFDPPAGAITVDQKGCLYAPRILGARAGQEIVFTNSDDTIHNISSKPKRSKGFNFVTPAGGSGKRTLDRPEVMVRVGCDVHPWMSAYIGVVDHPFFAVTGSDGAFRFTGLPPGTYQVGAWHERLGSTTVSVTLGANEAKAASIALPGP